LPQRKFAELGGVGLGSQHNYETGKQAPSIEYLIGLYKADEDVDVAYVITGERSQTFLKGDVSDLANIYLALDPEKRSLLMGVARLLRRNSGNGTLHEARAPYRAEGESDDNDEDF